MSHTQLLRYPRKSHRKTVTLPKYSEELAEFFGIMMGDGGINNPWQANITVNSIADADYAEFIVELVQDLFSLTPAVRKRKEKSAVVISLASTTVVDFLVANGLVRGNKIKGKVKVPKWILSKSRFRKACVRGLIDTDGCLYVHNHKVSGKEYQNIGFCFSNRSPELIRYVADTLEGFSIKPHIDKQGKQVYLYSESAVSKYLKVFGTSNRRIDSVYEKWRRRIVVYSTALERRQTRKGLESSNLSASAT